MLSVTDIEIGARNYLQDSGAEIQESESGIRKSEVRIRKREIESQDNHEHPDHWIHLFTIGLSLHTDTLLWNFLHVIINNFTIKTKNPASLSAMEF